MEVSMNKAELINAVAKEAEISKSKAAVALDTVIASISAALKGKEKVTLVGFGTFSTATRSARTGRNPRDGKTIKIAAKTVAKFKPGKKLADEVNGKGGKKKK
jgi:DNA-binding protein HU-beta